MIFRCYSKPIYSGYKEKESPRDTTRKTLSRNVRGFSFNCVSLLKLAAKIFNLPEETASSKGGFLTLIMITLYIAIGKENNIPSVLFHTTSDLLDYIDELRKFDCVWLFCGKAPNSEIVITESIDTVKKAIPHSQWDVDVEFHMHEYPSYEDAYAVALDMREGNNKCYNAQV